MVLLKTLLLQIITDCCGLLTALAAAVIQVTLVSVSAKIAHKLLQVPCNIICCFLMTVLAPCHSFPLLLLPLLLLQLGSSPPVSYKHQMLKSCCCCCHTGDLGVRLSKDLTQVAASALQKNMVLLGPLVLPFSEKFLFAINLIHRKLAGKGRKIPTYTPDFLLAFDHICIHSGKLASKFRKGHFLGVLG